MRAKHMLEQLGGEVGVILHAMVEARINMPGTVPVVWYSSANNEIAPKLYRNPIFAHK